MCFKDSVGSSAKCHLRVQRKRTNEVHPHVATWSACPHPKRLCPEPYSSALIVPTR